MFSLIPVPHWQGMSSQPSENHQFIPAIAITISQYISFGLVVLLLVMPTVISINQLVTSPRDVKQRIEAVRTTSTFPRVLIVMPVYNELPEVLHAAICSAIDGDYPKEHLHIFISFDNGAVSDLYRALISNLGVPAEGEYYPPVLDLYFRGVQITVSRFPHGGKRLTQKKTFGLINSIYKEYPDKTDHLFVLFIDSDIILPAETIANFVWDMELKPNSKNLLAMTGVITVTTKEDITFLNLLQDIEYVHGQFIGRAIESAVGGCVTLPGALTIFRYSAFLESYDDYFAERKVSDLWDFGRSHLGEDRYLTHLLMTKAARPKLIQFCHRATCKTEPVREWRNLMKQRRRWYLGFLTNEGAFLSDPRLWRKYPWLLSIRLVQDIVTGTSMVSYITIVAIASGMAHWSIIWLGLLVAYFILNWALMFTYGLWLGRYKALLYPLMFFIGPFVSWFLLVYGVITANERTWGGPRADAAAKKDKENGDVEKGEENEGDDQDQSRFGDEEVFSDSDDEQVELPDHLFYPQQQVPKRRRGRARRGPAKRNLNNDAGGAYRGDGILEAVVVDRESDRDEPGYDTGDDASDENSDIKVLDISEIPEFTEPSDENSADYFAPRPLTLSFASNPPMTADTEWWDDDKHLSSLGIVPFIHQPKIPEIFASVETLILTPIILSTPTSRHARSQSGVSISSSLCSYSSRKAQGGSKLRSTPGTPKMRPTSNLAKSAPSSPKIRPVSNAAPTRSTPGTPKMRPVYNAASTRSAPGTPKSKTISTFGGGQPALKETKSRSTTPTVPKARQSISAPGSPKHRPQSATSGSKRGHRQSGRSQSIHSSADMINSLESAPTSEPLPRHSFCYVPVEFLTPNVSAPTTPRMSPMILPSFSISGPPSDSCCSTPPIPSPAIPYANLPNASALRGSSKAQDAIINAAMSKAPEAILNAALAILNNNGDPYPSVSPSSTSSSSSSPSLTPTPPPPAMKKMPSRSRVFQTSDNVPPVPAIPNVLQSTSTVSKQLSFQRVSSDSVTSTISK
ncbi:hypothetical protein BGZ80_005702 [Entomortierella chlamydospora]|uniref:chitin synthase n=1 Tax=Entomortierella chlamydospora TaxID=101097 RepID=A0A9P6T2C0_9FUNG|nr:hypothetical protein BGZ80_005702 [Entomortierella chlamydospora]